MSDSRARFLARIRQRLTRTPGASPTPEASPLERSDHPGHDPALWVARFLDELAAVGGSGETAAPEQVPHRCAVYAHAHGIRRAVAWHPDALASPDRQLLAAALSALERTGVEVTRWPLPAGVDQEERVRSLAAAAELGIVVSEAAVATSGTIMVSSGPGKGRAVSLLPERLLALVSARALRPTLTAALRDVAARTRAGDIPQNVSFITGPSKSADIELELVTGVHGPREVHAIVVVDPQCVTSTVMSGLGAEKLHMS